MLVLTRKTNQDIIIHDPKSGETYQVTVTEISGDSVRLGITAPATTEVHRREIYDIRKQETQT